MCSVISHQRNTNQNNETCLGCELKFSSTAGVLYEELWGSLLWSFHRDNIGPPTQNLVCILRQTKAHKQQEDIERFMTHTLRLSGENRVDFPN